MNIYAFFLNILIGVNGRLLCGDSFSQYDPRTHFCKDGSILIKSRASLSKHMVCGEHFTMYDNTTHACENGSVVLRTLSPQSILVIKNSITASISGRLLCGDSFSQYDPRTHFCKDGSILIKSRASLPKHMVCGEHFTMYDNTTHSCENGSVILRTPPPQSLTKNSVTASTILSGNVCRERVVLNCSGNVYESCAKKGTYDCCGGRSYQPAYDSCCNSLVYTNKPQRKHVCCKSTLYQRKKSSAPCQRNDAFLQGGGKAKSLTSKNMRSFICNRGDKYAYYMKITGPHHDENGRYLTAIRITKYLWSTCANTCQINERRTKVRIPLDEFSPSSLGRRSFLILSNYQYLHEDHFYRREGDLIFKAPRKRSYYSDCLQKCGKRAHYDF